MIVWANGAFGSGKTTLVAELHRRWPEAQITQCVAAVDTLRSGTVLLDGERPTRELADEVLTHVGTESQ
ncbi:hypothetical protein OHA79_37175 [Streptomyces sp. NBC_00841]|uniref:hypothetical protein n=1 Tax=Streptomyces sp. NBC_01669 TaxID=2975909 RepID=UPI002254AFA8|nr:MULTISPECIES: hypothetical protein [unclassified Streptomyces]MCX4531438.1 hypothetical protein [Streptomyces sp. NBC_01669]WSA02984.1 hypothetical protein OHA79_37175 [Streptomyces sp. NBC_00841]